MVRGSTLSAALRRVRIDWRRAAAVIVLQPLLALVAVRVPFVDQFPGVLLIAGALTGSYVAGALVGTLSLFEALAVFLALPRHAQSITAGGVVAGFAVAALAGIALSRALARNAEQERRAVEQRFRALFESAAVGVTLATIDGIYLEANDMYCELVGRTRGEVVGRHFSEFVAPGEGGDPEVLDAILGGDPGPFRFDGALLDAAGARVPVRVTVSLVRDDDGAPLYTVAILESIAAQRRLEAQMRQKQKMEAIGQLAGGIAHDFNNLLTVIGGNVLLAGMTALPDDARSHVAEISAAADRAGALTRQLLTFSRAQEPELGEIDLNRLVAGLEDMLARLIGADVAVDVRLEPGLPAVLADPVQLELVLINLAANARDAMPEGGRLAISTERAGDAVALSVSDTGTGMDDATRERVFEPFFTTKRAGEGTGLGLANVYGIVLRAGGEIEVESTLGEGSTFRVVLPATASESVAALLDDDEEEEDLAAKHGCVLFVDDEPSVRRIAGVALSRAGHDAVLAASGEEALDLLASGRPVDLLVTDVVMPGMNGIELAERVRAERPEVAILFVSGYADRVLGAYSGADPIEVLDKPFTPAALAERVAQALAAV